ncbi:lysozyme inhibitor LprI family protein [Longimicrobium terrae]|nr:lysozyme inhibitor LprI family protein [Longimicrobium terrae]
MRMPAWPALAIVLLAGCHAPREGSVDVRETQAASPAVGQSFAQARPECDAPMPIVEKNACLARELAMAEAELRRTEAAILQSLPDSVAAATFRRAARAGTEYRDLLCLSLYQSYQGGSLGGMSIMLCKIRLTRERTRAEKEQFTMNG